jgi:hypothetical protein
MFACPSPYIQNRPPSFGPTKLSPLSKKFLSEQKRNRRLQHLMFAMDSTE